MSQNTQASASEAQYNNGISWIPTGEELNDLFAKRLAHFRESLDAFLTGRMDVDTFRRIRLALGVYYQNPEVSYMSRIKIPAGYMTYDQVQKLCDVGDWYARGLPHISTRQNIQYHYVPVDRLPHLFEHLWTAGIETIGASADGARNVTADQFGGVDPDEVLDPTPYALLLNAFYRFHAYNLKLPRKYKIAVSGGPADRAQVGINCLGFMAREQDGVKGFDVYVGGGLGAMPFPAVNVGWIPAEDILLAADAIMRLYHDHGERKNRKKARIKMVVQRLGREKFIELYQQYYRETEQRAGSELRAKAVHWLATEWKPTHPALPAEAVRDAQVDAADFARWKERNTLAQKQKGYYAVSVKLDMGDLTTDQFRSLAELARIYGNAVVRATDLQKLVLAYIPEGVLPAVYQRLVELKLADAGVGLISDIVSCPGLDYCTLAVAKSRSLGDNVRAYLRQSNIDERELGSFNLQMSGCPNACGQHSAAHIGATGMMIKDAAGVDRPHFSFFVGGRCAGDRTVIAQRVHGRYAEDAGPKVIGELAADYIRNRKSGEDYADYVGRQGIAHINTIATRYLSAAEAAL